MAPFPRTYPMTSHANVYIHPSSVIDEPCQIGAGTRIWHFCHVMPEAVIGDNCALGQNTFVARGVRIGNGVRIQNNVSIYEGVTLEDDVFCGPSCVFTNVINPRSAVSRRDEFMETLVRRGASIGANVTIVCGNTIGSYAFIGAGAVVTRDVPDYALMVGVPARRVGWMCSCGEKVEGHEGSVTCEQCGARYTMDTDRLVPHE